MKVAGTAKVRRPFVDRIMESESAVVAGSIVRSPLLEPDRLTGRQQAGIVLPA